MVSGRYLPFFLALPPLLCSCATNDLLVKRQTETEARVEHLYQNSGEFEGRLNQLASRLTWLEGEAARNQARISELESRLKPQKQPLQAVAAESTTETAPSPLVEVINPLPADKVKSGGPPDGYIRAFGLYSSNSFAAAITAFEQFLKDEPSSEYAPNAHYWIGECYYSSNNLTAALAAFQKVVNDWPRHLKAPDALLKVGYCYSAMKKTAEARESFERLTRNYPASPAAIKGRERLTTGH